MKRAFLLLLGLTSCSDRRAYEELARALAPPVKLLCSTQRKDIDAVGCFGDCTRKRAAEDARILSRAASAFARLPGFTGGEPTKRLVTQLKEQAVVLETAYKEVCEAPAAERACAERRSEARMLKAEAELEDLLTKIAHAPDHPSDVAFPDPAHCSP